MEGNMISSVSDKSNKFGTSHCPEYDMEAAVILKSGAVGQEHVVNRTFLSAVVGFCYGEQRMQNRGKKGFQTSQPERTQHQSFYPLQHRCTKLLSWPLIAVLIGVVMALLVFGCYSPSTKSITSAASPSSRISHGQAEAAVRSRLDGGFHSRRAGWELVGGKRTLLQAQRQLEEEVFANNTRSVETFDLKGKYLRGKEKLDAELRRKRRRGKNENEETEAPPVETEAPPPPIEEDPQGILFENLSERFPLVGDFIRKHPFYYVYLLSFSTNDTIINFFDFCHEFPQLADMVHWAPPLLFYLVYLRGTLGHTAFSVLLICFLAFPIVFILILFLGPRQFFHRFLNLLLRFQRKKRS